MCDFSHAAVAAPCPVLDAETLRILAPIAVCEPFAGPVAVLSATRSRDADDPEEPGLLLVLSTTRVPTLAEEPTPDPVAVRAGFTFQFADDVPLPEPVAVRRTIRNPKASNELDPVPLAVRSDTTFLVALCDEVPLAEPCLCRSTNETDPAVPCPLAVAVTIITALTPR